MNSRAVRGERELLREEATAPGLKPRDAATHAARHARRHAARHAAKGPEILGNQHVGIARLITLLKITTKNASK